MNCDSNLYKSSYLAVVLNQIKGHWSSYGRNLEQHYRRDSFVKRRRFLTNDGDGKCTGGRIVIAVNERVTDHGGSNGEHVSRTPRAHNGWNLSRVVGGCWLQPRDRYLVVVGHTVDGDTGRAPADHGRCVVYGSCTINQSEDF